MLDWRVRDCSRARWYPWGYLGETAIGARAPCVVGMRRAVTFCLAAVRALFAILVTVFIAIAFVFAFGNDLVLFLVSIGVFMKNLNKTT